MPKEELQPTVGSWYESDDGQVFMVLAVDKARDAIDVRYITGRLDTIDMEAWAGMDLREVEPLEEWQASMEQYAQSRSLREYLPKGIEEE
ncbi:MAG: hypothetical protein IDH49_05860 [Gammaproteobacteria bacterium]|nr:hypothetical protein [Gammaproteobacteria bacterium]